MAYFFHVLIVYNCIIVVFLKVSGMFGPPRISEYATVIASLVCSGVAANSCDDGGVEKGRMVI